MSRGGRQRGAAVASPATLPCPPLCPELLVSAALLVRPRHCTSVLAQMLSGVVAPTKRSDRAGAVVVAPTKRSMGSRRGHGQWWWSLAAQIPTRGRHRARWARLAAVPAPLHARARALNGTEQRSIVPRGPHARRLARWRSRALPSGTRSQYLRSQRRNQCGGWVRRGRH